MADYITNDTELTSIANAIRTKGGTSTSLVYPSGFISAINAIPTGSSIDVEALTITQNGTYTAPTGKAYSPITVSVQGGVLVTEATLANGGIIKSITASPVISGTLSITSNGTFDVASYASAFVSVAGSAPNLSSLTVTPTESQQAFTPAAGFDGYNSVTVNSISSNYVGTGVSRRSSTDLTASGSTVTVPSGYYSAQATKNIAAGTEGTPTATKGTVSNNSVSVTPTVTNSAGYISGGTKTGTAVTVSASELVSGTLNITSNNTYNVANYANVSVAIPIVTYYTGTSDPSSSTGSNGDIYLKVAS